MSSVVPQVRQRMTSVWAQYTIRLKPGTARRLAAALKAAGHSDRDLLPKPLHQQPAYRDFPVADGGVPVSEQLSGEVISLPMHAYLEQPTQDRIIAAVRGVAGLRSTLPRSPLARGRVRLGDMAHPARLR